MSTVRVQARGRVTLPVDIRRRAGIEPGTTLFAHIVRPGEIRLIALPKLTPDELRQRFPIDVEIDWHRDREIAEAEAAQHVIRD